MSLIPNIVNWYGGKNKLARQIISIMPEHEHYIEVFMGSAAVFFSKPKVQRNTINDFNSNLVNLFIQVRDHYDELAEKVYWTLYSRQEYEKFYKLYQNNFEGIDDLTRGMMYLFLVRASFNSMTGLGFSASIESNSANFNLALIERLKLAREKLDSVVIENRSFSEIIPKYDVKGSFLYLDPPYYVTVFDKAKHYYEKRMSEIQHLDLQARLTRCKSPWIMSYDDLPEVVELYKEFNIMRLSVSYSLSNTKKKVKKINELLITNFKSKKPQLDIFDEAVKMDEVTDEEKDSSEVHVKLKRELEFEEQLKPKKQVSRLDKPEVEQIGLF
jgi:DNA adenine methylase